MAQWTKDRERHLLAALFYPAACFLGYQIASPKPDWTLSGLHANIPVTVLAFVLLVLGATFVLVIIRIMIPEMKQDKQENKQEKFYALIAITILMAGVALLAFAGVVTQAGRNQVLGFMTWIHGHAQFFPTGEGISPNASRQSFLVAGVIVMTVTATMWHHRGNLSLRGAIHKPSFPRRRKSPKQPKPAKQSKEAAAPYHEAPPPQPPPQRQTQTVGVTREELLHAARLGYPEHDPAAVLAQLRQDNPDATDEDILRHCNQQAASRPM